MGKPRFPASRTSLSTVKHSSDKELNVIKMFLAAILTYFHVNMEPLTVCLLSLSKDVRANLKIRIRDWTWMIKISFGEQEIRL